MLRGIVLDNPLLLKHIRARLRPQQLLPMAVVVTMVSGVIAWAGVSGETGRGEEAAVALGFLLVGQAVLVLLLGSSGVARSVSEARESGMLDLHRISPQRATTLTAGFLLGGPIREYVLFACTLPFSGFLALAARLHPLSWLAMLVAIVSAGLLYHAAAIIVVLTGPEQRAGAAAVVVLVVMLHMFAGPGMSALLPLGYLTIVPTVTAAMSHVEVDKLQPVLFLGQPGSALALSLMHQLPLVVFFLIAAVRKIREQVAVLYPKPTALLFYLTLALLTLMDVSLARPRGHYDLGFSALPAIYVLFGFALLLCMAVTPGRAQFNKGVRQARKLGLSDVPAWSDWAVNWTPVLVLALMLLSAGLTTSLVRVPRVGALEKGVAASAIATLTLLYFGYAKQSLDLAFPRHSSTYFALLLFLLWGMPLLLGAAASATAFESQPVKSTFAVSPVAGIGIAYAESYRFQVPTVTLIALGAALVPAIAFAVICLYVVRRIGRQAAQ